MNKSCLLLCFLLFLSSCAADTPQDIQSDHGDQYFTMDCVWRGYNDGQTLWWCEGHPETELLTGDLLLELLEDNKLAFCGENITLNTGHDLHDSLIALLTNGQFNCITSVERELGNEFDWIWEKENRTLKLIWRPDDASYKKITLVIDPGTPAATVNGTVYYTELE